MDIDTRSNLRFRYLMTTLSPERTVSSIFRLRHHQKPDLVNPKTLDEKIQWMKLHYYKDNGQVKECSDKIRVRNYLKKNGLEHILTKITAICHDPDEINWDMLPDKFVLKWNFGNGSDMVCTDKNKMDKDTVVGDLKRFQKLKFHLLAAEPQHDVEEKLLLCEEFIEPEHGNCPTAYRFLCFNGEAKYVLRNTNIEEGQPPAPLLFDREWQLQRLNRQGKEAPDGFTAPKPDGIDPLFDYAGTLSKPFPFVCVSFFLEHGHGWFVGMDFSPEEIFGCGLLPESDLLLGKMVRLPLER